MGNIVDNVPRRENFRTAFSAQRNEFTFGGRHRNVWRHPAIALDE